MAMYSAKEMKEKMSGHVKVRELELKDNKSVKVWIPKNEFYYEKKHFNIQMVDKFKQASARAVTCINSDGNVGQCPVCEYIQSLWEKWRKTDDKGEKKELQNIINRLSIDMYYVNVVDITDKAYRCMSLRLTASMFRDISKVIDSEEGDSTEIHNVIWTIKKTNNNKKITYSVLEDLGDDDGPNPIAVKLTKNMAKICDREEKDGGYINLDKAYSRNLTLSEYNQILFGIDSESDEEPEQISTSKKKQPVKVDEDEKMSLDDIDEEPVKKPATQSQSKKQVVEDDDDLDLDDELDEKPVKKPAKPAVVEEDDNLDLDDDIDEEPVKKTTKKPVVEDDDDLELDEEPVKKPATQNHSKKQAVEEEDDLDLDDLELDNIPF